MIWETKGLTLEQVDRMMEECGSPRRSAGWKPHSTFAHDMGMTGAVTDHKAAIGHTAHGEEKAQNTRV
jgi:SP family sugar:H+ symporter-like MFS transporter